MLGVSRCCRCFDGSRHAVILRRRAATLCQNKPAKTRQARRGFTRGILAVHSRARKFGLVYKRTDTYFEEVQYSVCNLRGSIRHKSSLKSVQQVEMLYVLPKVY
jgi:hypothetical protein